MVRGTGREPAPRAPAARKAARRDRRGAEGTGGAGPGLPPPRATTGAGRAPHPPSRVAGASRAGPDYGMRAPTPLTWNLPGAEPMRALTVRTAENLYFMPVKLPSFALNFAVPVLDSTVTSTGIPLTA